jgi:uncharacterized membrane protein YdjX (TVP38/TMEM64 family)
MKNSAPGKRQRRRPAWGKILAIALVAAALFAAWRYTPLADYLTAERVNGWAQAMRATPWAPLGVVLAYTVASYVMFPRPLITIASVIAFGTWIGFAYALAGLTAAALSCYYLGRLGSEKTVRRITGDHMGRISNVLRRNAFVSMFALHLLPTPPFVVQGAVAGALRLNVWKYSAATLAGNIPGMLVTTLFGGQLANALGDSDMSYWLLGVAIVAFVALTFFVRRWFARQLSEEERAAPAGQAQARG